LFVAAAAVAAKCGAFVGGAEAEEPLVEKKRRPEG